jgi:nucleoid-associated protein YgaU
MHESPWQGSEPTPPEGLTDAPTAPPEGEVEAEAPSSARTLRIPRTLREARIAIAATLSVVLLVGALSLLWRGRGTKADPRKNDPVATNGKGKDKSKVTPSASPKPVAAKPKRPPAAPPIVALPSPINHEAPKPPSATQPDTETPPPPTAVASDIEQLADETPSPVEPVAPLGTEDVPPMEGDDVAAMPPLPAAAEEEIPALALDATPDPPPPLTAEPDDEPSPPPLTRETPAVPEREAAPTPPPSLADLDPPAVPAPEPTRPVDEPPPTAMAAAPSPTPAPVPSLTPPPSSELPPGLTPLPNAGRQPLRLEQPIEPARAVVTVPITPRRARTAPAPAPTADRVEATPHVVQSGENFWTIARLYYGSGRFYKALWKANADRVPRPEDLHVGDTIRVPPPEQLDPKLVDHNATSPSAPRRDAEAKRVAQAPGSLVMLPVGRPSRPMSSEDDLEPERPAASHLVRPRETLRTIARDRLGDSRREDEIRDMNLDQLEDNLALRPGMRLRLPADATEPTVVR